MGKTRTRTASQPSPFMVGGVIIAVIALVGVAFWNAHADPAEDAVAVSPTHAPLTKQPLPKPSAPTQSPVDAAPKPVASAAPAAVTDDLPPSTAPAAPAPAHATAEIKGKTETVQVSRVVDGDTVHLEDGRKVRLVGINTPEFKKPMFFEAKALVQKLVEGQTLTLEWDADRVDKYKRALAHLHREDGLYINGEVVRRGLGYCYTWRPNTAHEEELRGFQREARDAKRGLWALPSPEPAKEYHAGLKAHRFHRPSCWQVRKIRGDRQVFPTRFDAFDRGLNPCDKCGS